MVDFSKDRWQRVRETYGKWWDKKTDKVVMGIAIPNKDPKRFQPNVPILSQSNCHDFSISAEDLIDRLDYELSKFTYYGDSFPSVNMDCFGPGVVAAFLGARIDNSTGNVWFHCDDVKEISKIHLEYNPDNIWLNRIKEIYRAGMDRWQGNVIMGLPDLGGAFDILSTFRPGEMLMYDLYDEPDEVKRVINEISDL